MAGWLDSMFDPSTFRDGTTPPGWLGLVMPPGLNLPQTSSQQGAPQLPGMASAAGYGAGADLPPQAAPAQGQLPPQPSPQAGPSNPFAALFGSGQAAPQTPAVPAGPGPLDHLSAAWQGLGHGGLTSALGGLITGQRQDPEGRLQEALTKNYGVAPDMAAALVKNPQFLQMAAPQILAAPQQQATTQALIQAGVPAAVAHAAALNPEVLKTIAPQLYSKPEFKTIKNALGEDIPVFANADKQTITYPTANGGQGGAAGGPGVMQQTFDQIEAARNQGATPQQMLQAVPNSLRSGVEAMLSGGAIPSNLSNRGAARDLTLRFAHAIDPTFDESLIPARVALQKSYQGGGKNFQETLALNTVGGHLSTLADAADGLGNTGFKPWNWLKNQATDATVGNPDLVRFRNALVTTQNELAKAYHGGHVSDSAYNAFNNAIGEAQTPAELKAAVGQLATLLQSKIKANETGYQAGMNGLPLPSQYRAINDEAQHSFDKIDKWVGGQAPQQQTQQQQTMAPIDQQALAWANANSSDPRAAAIKQRLGAH